MPVTSRPFSPLVALALLALGLAFTAVPLWNLLDVGPFLWHIGRPGAVQGGAELAALVALVFAATLLPGPRWRAAVAVALIALYMRRHAVDVPTLLVMVYLELIIALGVLVLRLARAGEAPGLARYVQAIVPGIGAMAVIYLIASLLDYGTSRDLGVVALVVSLVVLPWARSRPLTAFVLARAVRGSLVERFGFAVFACWLASLCARTNDALGYDSAWYGLRGHLVLAPRESFFDETGLVSPVNYFPKLAELLMLPLNRLPDFSYMFALTIGCYALVALVAHAIARRLGADRRGAVIAMLLALSLPAVANLALTTKADILALLFLMIAAYWALGFVATRGWPAFFLALFATGFATQAKLTSAPFGLAIVLAALALGCPRGRALATTDANGPSDAAYASTRMAVVVGVLLALVVAGLTWRTYVLTGLPTIGPDPLFRLWLTLGLELREPVGTLSWINPQDWSDVPALLNELVLRPAMLPHVIITWTGNVWLWLSLLALIAWRSFGAPDGVRARQLLLVGTCVLCGAWLAIGQRYIERGGDGNYFMFAPVLAIVALVPEAMRLIDRLRAGTLLYGAIAVFATFHFGYAFVSANWAEPGTRVWDLGFTRGVVDTPGTRRAYLGQVGVAGIDEWLAARPSTAPVLRIVGTPPDIAFMLLRASYEPVEQVLFARNAYFQSGESFARYLATARIDGLIVPHDKANLPPHQNLVVAAAERWRVLPGASVVRGERFDLVLRPAAGSPPISPADPR